MGNPFHPAVTEKRFTGLLGYSGNMFRKHYVTFTEITESSGGIVTYESHGRTYFTELGAKISAFIKYGIRLQYEQNIRSEKA